MQSSNVGVIHVQSGPKNEAVLQTIDGKHLFTDYFLCELVVVIWAWTVVLWQDLLPNNETTNNETNKGFKLVIQKHATEPQNNSIFY